MCTRKYLLNIKGISEAKVDKIKGVSKLLNVCTYIKIFYIAQIYIILNLNVYTYKYIYI